MLKTLNLLSALACFLIGVADFELHFWTLGVVLFAVCWFNLRVYLALAEMDDDYQ